MSYLRVGSVPAPGWAVVIVLTFTFARLLVGRLLRFFIVIIGGIGQSEEAAIEQTGCKHTFINIFPEMESDGRSPYPV